MTTYKGIAAVTQTLGYLVGSAARAAVPEVSVTLARPEEPAAGSANAPRLNVYLVQVTPEATMRGNDLPTRTPSHMLTKAPQAPVNLRYLLSFFGTSEKAHLMLGAAELVLREHAVLDPVLIKQALTHHHHLQDSGLELQVPPVRVVPSLVTLEELSRFWSGFLQMPYTVSTVYEAMTVILTSASTPTATLPVNKVAGKPHDTAPKQLDPLPTVQFDAHHPTLVPVTGRGLTTGDSVEIANSHATLTTTPTGLAFELPHNTPAGAQTVQLAASRQTLLIRPALEAISAHREQDTTTATVTVAPPTQPGQQTRLSLVNTNGATSATVTVTATTQTSRLTFTLPQDLPAGSYLALLEVDGVSTLPVHADGRYEGPLLKLAP